MTDILLILSIIASFVLIFIIKIKAKEQKVANIMALLFAMLILWCTGLLCQLLAIKFNVGIDAIYFDYITYIGICFTPPIAVIMSLKYSGKSLTNKLKLGISIVPIVALLVLWTNDLHHLFYVTYSVNFNEAVYGPMFNVNSMYSYFMMFIFLTIMITTSIKKSGFFSMQTGLIVFGSMLPLIVNIMGTLRIINISIYVTPILFVFTFICYAISIIKYKVLNITPIALRTVMDNMSDSFVVISNDGTIIDENYTFKETFAKIVDIEKITNFFDYSKNSDFINYDNLTKYIKSTRETGNKITVEYEMTKDSFHKHFEVDIQPIKSKHGNEFVATLLLLKDVTQHKNDIETIEEKQDIIIKQSQLVTIGELAGGVAHDINTPISAIKSGILMFREMLGQRTENEMELLQRMDNCADKIIKIVNSMRNQIRNLGGTTNVEFKIIDVINDIKIISYNEVKKNNCELIINVEDDLTVKGDPTKLGQVLTNLIVNGVQAYKGKGGKVEVILTKAPDNMALIKVIDYAGGMDESIKPYVFKNILTTKGTLGTGLGLYLAYSVIKGEFGGEITFESEVGVGTTFYVAIKRS